MTSDQKDALIAIIQELLDIIDNNVLLLENEDFVQKMMVLRTTATLLRDKVIESKENELDFKTVSSSLIETVIIFTNNAVKDINYLTNIK